MTNGGKAEIQSPFVVPLEKQKQSPEGRACALEQENPRLIAKTFP